MSKNKKAKKLPNKPVRRYIALIFVPILVLIIVALLQLAIQFVFTETATVASAYPATLEIDDGNTYEVPGGYESDSSSNALISLVNVISIIAGSMSVIAIMLLPLWVYLLVVNSNFNNAQAGYVKSRSVAITLAIAFGFWTFLYTYKTDAVLFWVFFALSVLTVGILGIIGWIFAVVRSITRNDAFYHNYLK